MPSFTRLPIIIAAALWAFAPSSVSAQGVDWTLAPYFWIADVGVDTNINGDPALGVDVPFSDLVDKLDGAFMIHVEARGPKFGAFMDFITMSLSDTGTTPIGPGGPILGDLGTDTRLDLDLIEVAGTYRWGEAVPGGVGVDAIVGIRYVDVGQRIAITLPGPGANDINRNLSISEFDFLLGARVLGHFNENWTWRLRGDYSNGGTDGIINLSGTVGWKFGSANQFALEGGYRHMMLEFSDNLGGGVRSNSDITFTGPIFGFLWTF